MHPKRRGERRNAPLTTHQLRRLKLSGAGLNLPADLALRVQLGRDDRVGATVQEAVEEGRRRDIRPGVGAVRCWSLTLDAERQYEYAGFPRRTEVDVGPLRHTAQVLE